MPTAAIPSQPYRKLVCARVFLGWDRERAAAEPFVPRARLTADDVARVRASTAPSAEVAVQFAITVRQVQRIRAGYRWKAA